MTGPPPSGIRKYYEKLESLGERNEKYICGICSSIVSSSVAATSNLIKHIRRHHPNEFESYLREQGKGDSPHPSRSYCAPQPRPGGSGSSEKRLRIVEPNNDSHTRRLIRFLAGTLTSPSIVDSQSFIQFVNGLEPRFSVPPSHQLNIVILPQIYEDIKEKLKESLLHLKGICLTVDVFKNNYENFIFVISGSCISADWKKCSSLLACKLFKSLPSKPLITSTYESTSAEMNLTNKVQSIVIGKMRNKKSKDIFLPGWEHNTGYFWGETESSLHTEEFDHYFLENPLTVKCFSEVLNDVVAEGLRAAVDFQEQIAKISSLVYVINVILSSEEIGNLVSAKTNWIKQIKFIKMCLRLPTDTVQHAISSFTCEDQKSFINPNDQSLLNQLVEVLEAFEEAYERLENESEIASSQVIPIIRGLRHHLGSLDGSVAPAVVHSLTLAMENLMGPFEKNESLQLASMVDPRFKTAWCTSEEHPVLESKLQMNAVALSMEASSADLNWRLKQEESPKLPKLFSYMSTERPSPKTWSNSDINECAREEVSRFLSSPCREIDVHPLDFWRGMETEFPLVASVARKFLCTVVSTTSNNDIIGEDYAALRVAHLREDEFEKLLFLKYNIDQI